MLSTRPSCGTASALVPFLLLAVCGVIFASKIMLSKAALDVGADPFQLGVIGNLGAALILSALLVRRNEAISLKPRAVMLYLTLGLVSVAVPVVLSFFVVQNVGPAYTATVYALSPILTMSFAAGFGVERMTAQRTAGIVLGLLGMIVLVQQQLSAIRFDQTAWVIGGLLIPAGAALGNVIRTAFWPAKASAMGFACATLFVSSLIMAMLSPLFSSPAGWNFAQPSVNAWLGGYILISALSYVLNFRLQRIAGPVIFSQIGYWGTGFGILLAAMLFGDVLTRLSLGGLLAIALGGVLASRRPPRHRVGA